MTKKEKVLSSLHIMIGIVMKDMSEDGKFESKHPRNDMWDNNKIVSDILEKELEDMYDY